MSGVNDAIGGSGADGSVFSQARELVADGSYEEARSLLLTHLDGIESSSAREIDDMLKCQNLLGFILHETGDLQQAKTVQTGVVRFIDERFGLDNDSGEVALVNLGGTLTDLAEFESATDVWREVVQVRRQRLGENDPSTLRAISSLADTLRRAGRFSEAHVVDSDVLTRAVEEGLESRFVLDVKRNVLNDLVGLREWREAAQTAEDLYNAGITDLDLNDELRLYLEQNRRKFKRLRRMTQSE